MIKKIISLVCAALMLMSMTFAADEKAQNFDYTDEQKQEAYDYIFDYLKEYDYDAYYYIYRDTTEFDDKLNVKYIDKENGIYGFEIVPSYIDDGMWYEEFSYCIIDHGGDISAEWYVINGDDWGYISEMDEKGLVPDEVFEVFLSNYHGYRKSEMIKGDINHDNSLDIADVVFLRNAITNYNLTNRNDPYDEIYQDGLFHWYYRKSFDCADMNSDGVIDILDIVIIRNNIVNKG